MPLFQPSYQPAVIASYNTVGTGQSFAAGANTIVNYDTKQWDSHNGVTTGAAWKFVAPVAGTYHFDAAIALSGTAGNVVALSAFKNGGQFKTGTECAIPTAQPITPTVSCDVQLAVGDYVDFRVWNTGSGAATPTANNTLNWCDVHLVQPGVGNPLSAPIVASYQTAAAQSCANVAFTIINYDTKMWDSNNAVTTGAGWKFVAPITGTYHVDAVAELNVGNSSTGEVTLSIWKSISGGAFNEYKRGARTPITTSNAGADAVVSADVQLNAGDAVQIQMWQACGVAKNLVNSGAVCWVDIHCVSAQGGVQSGATSGQNGLVTLYGTPGNSVQPVVPVVDANGRMIMGKALLGSSGFAMAAGSDGDLWLNNGSTDTPGVHFQYGANTNFGIDSSGAQLRIVKNLDESGGAVLAYFDTGNVFYNAGQIAAGGKYTQGIDQSTPLLSYMPSVLFVAGGQSLTSGGAGYVGVTGGVITLGAATFQIMLDVMVEFAPVQSTTTGFGLYFSQAVNYALEMEYASSAQGGSVSAVGSAGAGGTWIGSATNGIAGIWRLKGVVANAYAGNNAIQFVFYNSGAGTTTLYNLHCRYWHVI